MLPITRGIEPEPLTQRNRFICRPGSSPSQAEKMTPCLLRVHLQDRADRRVDLGVHQHDVLAVLERLERDPGAELDRAGHVDEDVDLLGAAEQRARPP